MTLSYYKMNPKSYVIFCLISLVVGVYSKKLPSFLDPCKRGDPKIDDCLRHNVDLIRPRLREGIPELFIPPLNPLVIPKAVLDGGESFKATFTNIRIVNAENFVLEKLSVNWENSTLMAKVVFPSINMKSDYHMEGELLILKLNGKGTADGNFTEVSGTLSTHSSLYTKKGKPFLKVDEDYYLDLDIGNAHVQYDNLFGDNEELNVRTNALINENIQEFIIEVKPLLKQIIGSFGYGIVARVYDRYSYDDLFPNP